MALKVTRVDIWAASIEDQPGAVAAKLAALAQAGANLRFALARRAPETPGAGVIFLTPLKGAAQLRAAKAAGFDKVNRVHSVRIEAADKPGLAAWVARQVAEAGVNLRGFSAAGIGKKAVIYLGLDSADDAKKVARALKRK
jgi:hypothetical protein